MTRKDYLDACAAGAPGPQAQSRVRAIRRPRIRRGQWRSVLPAGQDYRPGRYRPEVTAGPAGATSGSFKSRSAAFTRWSGLATYRPELVSRAVVAGGGDRRCAAT